MLNVVGSRLRDNRTASVTLISYDDGTTEGEQISSRRSRSIKDYLITTFGVDDARVQIEDRRGQASQEPWVFIQDENRDVLGPVTAKDTLSETSMPSVRISPDVVSEEGVRQWRVLLVHDGEVVDSILGYGDVPSSLVWDPNEQLDPAAVFNAPRRHHVKCGGW